MEALTLADIRTKYQDKLFPAPGEQPAPYFAGPGRKAPAARPARQKQSPAPRVPAIMAAPAETILAAYERCGNWSDTARALGTNDWDLRSRRLELKLVVPRNRKVRFSDAEILAAYAKHGSFEKTAAALGIPSGGSFSRRLKAAQSR